VVGIREQQELFLEDLSLVLGTNADALPVIPEFPATKALAERLRRLPEAEILIEQDLEIYHHLKSAIDAAVSGWRGADVA
jgi:hypothetical protein